ERYWNWASGFVQGNLGSSVAGQAVSGEPTPISGLIGDRIRNTAVLALCTVLLLVPLSLVLGVLSAMRAGRPVDHAVTGISLASSRCRSSSRERCSSCSSRNGSAGFLRSR